MGAPLGRTLPDILELGYIAVAGGPGLHEACYRARCPLPFPFVRLEPHMLGYRFSLYPPVALIVSESVAATHSDELLEICHSTRVPLRVAGHASDVGAAAREVELLIGHLDLSEMGRQHRHTRLGFGYSTLDGEQRRFA